MQRERKLCLTICDYNKNAVCDIYDNQSDISGQATNVFVDTERNGWKELSFDIPSTCIGENGDQPNYRLDYLIAEYKIRAISDTETDWFIISEPKINRKGFSKAVSVRAPHISQLLKHKNLDLEFSDDEGNNVGTARALLTTILEGSGWTVGTVDDFREDDGSVKVRSITGQAGTGALSFIEKLCDAFEAKPIYNGDMTVDLLKMNPFAKIDPESIPSELVDNGNVIELNYDRNVHDLTKTNNTDNMVTRLYAYGSSGDLNGACTLQNAEHSEYEFTIAETGNEYFFEDLGETKHFFKGSTDVGDVIVWSDMDITSRTYVWNKTKEEAYRITAKPSGAYITLTNPVLNTVKNKFPYLLGLKYYDDVGLMSEEQFQEAARFQRELPEIYQTAEDAASLYAEDEQELSKIAESNIGFLKFSVTQDYTTDSDGAKRIYINDVLYRTDYDVAERKYFQWHIAKQLKSNGDPTSGTPSIIYILHNTNPVTWDRVYLKRIYNQDGILVQDDEGNPADFKYDTTDRPGSISVWSDDIRYDSSDQFYLFCTNSMSGYLGARQSEDEAVVENLQNTTTDGSEKHPTYFAAYGESQPAINVSSNSYCWFYQYHKDLTTPGTLYFCWTAKGDIAWHEVHFAQTAPTVVNGDYFFNLRYKTLWHGASGQWVQYTTAAEQRVANSFNKVFYYCRRRDMLYKGLYEYYLYSTPLLAPANYAIPNDYAFYWTFTTDQNVEGQLKLDTVKGQVYQDTDINHIVTSSVVPIETVFYPDENELSSMNFYHGTLDLTNGVEEDSDTLYRSGSLKVWENTQYQYNLPKRTSIVFYTISLAYISSLALTGSSESTGMFTTPANTRYVRFVTSAIPTGYVRVTGYDTKFYINDKPYNILSPVTTDGEQIGLIPLTAKFNYFADKTYAEDLVMLKTAQQQITSRNNELSENLGDMLKDGRWQDSNYIKGDEKRLYDEAYDMLRQISVPETSYSFTYLDMFGVKNEHYYEEHDVKWPDISITDTAHLIDTESKTNCWAYIDKIHKCYDQPWKTSIEIDTKLTLASRHGFTDVIARIADVAKEIKSKQPEYDRSAAGTVAASRLEGAISLFSSYLLGGSSNWYTDEKGNIILEAADGLSAMLLGGRGLCIANSKTADGDWEFRTAATGYGITADEIYTGYLSAERIEANSITTNKLMANVGQELDIGSNKALALFATVNGSRPAGTVRTTDGLIEIIAGSESGGVTIPAKINVISGGELNLAGGNVNISSSGKLDVSSDGEFTLKSHGANNLNSTADGIYIGSDGVNFGGGKFKVSFNGNTSTVKMDASLVQIGSASSDTLQKYLDDLEDAATNAQFTADAKSQTYRCTAAQIVNKPYKVGDMWINTDSTYKWEHICNTVSSTRNSTTDWTLISTAMTEGAALSVDAVNGTINMAAANSITIAAGATIDIAANKVLTLTTKGTITIGNGVKPFTIGATTGTSGHAYIYNGRSTVSTTDADGVYLGTDGLNIGKANGDYVIAKADGTIDISGKITAASGSIGNWTIGTDRIYSGSGASYVALATDTDYRIWAGNATNSSAPFSVKKDGTLFAKLGTVGGWTLAATSLTGNKTGLAKTTNDTDIAFWAGNSTASSAAFKVTQAGALTATSASIKGTLESGSTVACEISASKITSGTLDASKITVSNLSASVIQTGTLDASKVTVSNLSASVIQTGTMSADRISGGTLVLGGSNNTSGTLSIKNASGTVVGTWNNTGISATEGTIGGWTINSKSLSSGSGTSCIVLNADTSTTTGNKKDYAIWVGRDNPEGSPVAPFRVKRDGTVYLTSLKTVTESGTETTVNLTSYPLWKLGYHTVKSYTDNSITLSNGETVNFNTAASVTLSKSWSGNTYTVSNSGNDRKVTTSIVMMTQMSTSGSGSTGSASIGAIACHDTPALGNSVAQKSYNVRITGETSTAKVNIAEAGSASSVNLSIGYLYDDGVSAGYMSAKMSGSWTGGVLAISKNTTGSGSLTYSVTAGATQSYNSSTHKYTATATAYVDGTSRATGTKDTGTEAYDAGVTAGYASGDSAGYTRGYGKGYDAGYDDGYDVGEGNGYNSGYSAGFAAAEAQYTAVTVTPILSNTGTRFYDKGNMELFYQAPGPTYVSQGYNHWWTSGSGVLMYQAGTAATYYTKS